MKITIKMHPCGVITGNIHLCRVLFLFVYLKLFLKDLSDGSPTTSEVFALYGLKCEITAQYVPVNVTNRYITTGVRRSKCGPSKNILAARTEKMQSQSHSGSGENLWVFQLYFTFLTVTHSGLCSTSYLYCGLSRQMHFCKLFIWRKIHRPETVYLGRDI